MNILLLITMVCIPLMLCVKPIYLIVSGHGHAKHDDEVEMEDLAGGGYATSDNY